MSAVQTHPSTSTRTGAQWFALVSAGVYLSAGLIGFVVTGFDDFAGDTTEKLIILGINPLHNVVHLVLGGAWLAAAREDGLARAANTALGIGLLAAFALGVAGGAQFLNIDGASEPDNWLHLVWGALSVWAGSSAFNRAVGRA